MTPQTRPPDTTPGGANVLLMAPPMASCVEEHCVGMLSRGDPRETAVLVVTLSDTPDERIAAWERHARAAPATMGIVAVDEQGSGGGPQRPEDGIEVRTVSSPADLTGISIAVTGFLDGCDGMDIRVCFDSVTTLLQYVDLERTFRFLHVFTERTSAADATAHFHIDPGAHDTRTLSTVRSLFDEEHEV